jgi:hypothetical protein
MTPKSLLRNKDATSPLSEFTKGGFQTIIPENKELKADKVKRIVVCSGKVYYDLAKKREERGMTPRDPARRAAVPVPAQGVRRGTAQVPERHRRRVCQDEPQNQGAWFFVQHYIHENMLEGQKLGYSGPRGLGVAGSRLLAPAPGAAKGPGGRRVRQAEGLRPDQVIFRTRRRRNISARSTADRRPVTARTREQTRI